MVLEHTSEALTEYFIGQNVPSLASYSVINVLIYL